ncbi:WYL domain-containing protein [Paenibacillus sp. CAA11]|uniref:WYL domain-containing protein n=1 Tax=Paenibacillus sp. CAA11 TaxID=1532905 RepID=UPI000D3A5917|nr:WYL domain-containing protein [Paenibacillus sp. CAA11]AWB43476.1 WYL domain-containing protein [Paenibacillus sp. CAA11]
MNLFEKIFNYQLLSRLEDSGTFMVTAHERSWLKTMLQHPAAAEAFTPETLLKLQSILEQDPVMDTPEHLIEKVRSREKQVYHPLLRPLRRLIMNRQGVMLSYEIKGGRVQENQVGLPYKLEYSMVKREWYLLWAHNRHQAFMRTKLEKITAAEPAGMSAARAESLLSLISETLEARKSEAVIEVVPEYNRELSRILYALSSFEKDVEYDAERDMYTVTVCLMADEQEYLLSKLRFLGKRVKVVQGDYLQKRMLEAATKSLGRYGVTPAEAEASPAAVCD